MLRPNTGKTVSCSFHLNNRQANYQLKIKFDGDEVRHEKFPKISRSLSGPIAYLPSQRGKYPKQTKIPHQCRSEVNRNIVGLLSQNALHNYESNDWCPSPIIVHRSGCEAHMSNSSTHRSTSQWEYRYSGSMRWATSPHQHFSYKSRFVHFRLAWCIFTLSVVWWNTFRVSNIAMVWFQS